MDKRKWSISLGSRRIWGKDKGKGVEKLDQALKMNSCRRKENNMNLNKDVISTTKNHVNI